MNINYNEQSDTEKIPEIILMCTKTIAYACRISQLLCSDVNVVIYIYNNIIIIIKLYFDTIKSGATAPFIVQASVHTIQTCM